MYNLHNYQKKLVNEIRKAFKTGYKSPCVVAPCGAGKSVIISEIARMTTDNNKKILFLVHRKELIDQIKNTFQNNSVNMNLVHFGMVQTVVRKLEKIVRPDLIITDESHHGLANSYKKIYDYFPSSLRLGFTATPIRLNGDGLGEVADLLIEEVNANWLIENEFLAPYKYYAPKLINTDVLKLSNTREFTNSSMNKSIEKVIYGDVIKHYERLADGEQAICYCHSVEASILTEKAFLNVGIPAVHLDAKTPKNERNRMIENFRSGAVKIITNVDLIGEGFDVPDCGTVIMLRPTQSLSLYIQQSMRGMRYKKGKTAIVIDHVDNIGRFGLPTMERIWSLTKKRDRQAYENTNIKICMNCFAVYLAKYKKCSECGYVPVVNKEKTKYDTDKKTVLDEINKDEFNIKIDFRKPSDCKTMNELYDLAKNRNYKRGWAYHQGKLMGLIK